MKKLSLEYVKLQKENEDLRKIIKGKALEVNKYRAISLNHSRSQQRTDQRVLVFTLKFEIPQQPIKID